MLQLLIFLLTVACSLVEPEPTSGSIEDMLKFVPDTPDARSSIYFNDYAMLRDVSNVDSLEPGPATRLQDHRVRYRSHQVDAGAHVGGRLRQGHVRPVGEALNGDGNAVHVEGQVGAHGEAL